MCVCGINSISIMCIIYIYIYTHVCAFMYAQHELLYVGIAVVIVIGIVNY